MKRGIRILLAVVALGAVIFLLATLLSPGDSSPKTYTYLREELISGNVKEMEISTFRTVVSTNDGKEYTIVVPRTFLEDTIKELRQHDSEWWQSNSTKEAQASFARINISFTDPNEGSWFMDLLPYVLLIALVVVMFFFYRNAAGGGTRGAMNFGRTKAKQVEATRVRFSDVAGADEEKEELREVVEFLKSPQKFVNVGARIPRGILLVGPPGTGKTLLAKAVAGEAGVPFFTISGSDFVEMFVGVGASRVRDLFDQAKKNQPCIIFIDEIDAVGRQRGTGLGGGHDEREQTLNQLLVQMDGFDTNEGTIVLAATNRADVLDPALLRPGRFDRQVFVNKPDVKGREAIIQVHSRNKSLDASVDIKQVARLTAGFSGADIENLLNEAAILAARENRTSLTMTDITDAVGKVVMGPKKKSRLITESDKRVTAFHEAGHAIVGMALPNTDEVHEISIIPRGMAAGYTLSRPDGDDMHMSKNRLNDFLAMLIGGRVAEEIVIKDITTGATNDIQRSTQIAKSMVTEWGMSEAVGPMSLSGGQEVFLGRDFASTNSFSEQMTSLVDSEVRNILNKAHETATKLLNEKRSVMDNMARVLIEKETIYTEEIKLLMDGKTAAEVIEFIEKKEAEERLKREAQQRETQRRRMIELQNQQARAEAIQQQVSRQQGGLPWHQANVPPQDQRWGQQQPPQSQQSPYNQQMPPQGQLHQQPSQPFEEQQQTPPAQQSTEYVKVVKHDSQANVDSQSKVSSQAREIANSVNQVSEDSETQTSKTSEVQTTETKASDVQIGESAAENKVPSIETAEAKKHTKKSAVKEKEKGDKPAENHDKHSQPKTETKPVKVKVNIKKDDKNNK